MKKIFDKFKFKKIWIPTVAIVAILFLVIGAITGFIRGYDIGYEAVNIEIDNAIVPYNELVNNTKELEKEYNDRKEELDEAIELSDKKSELDAQIIKKNKELDLLNKDIAEATSKLSELQGKITEKDEKPIELPAGQFIVGSDIPEGRYKVTPNGSGGNFFVDDSNGKLVVSQSIREDGEYSVSEYVIFLEDGYSIEAASPFNYIPIKWKTPPLWGGFFINHF